MPSYRLEDVIQAHIERYKERTYTHEPAWVISHDFDKNTAAIQPAIPQTYYNELSEPVSSPKPIIQHVRVVMPFGKMLSKIPAGTPGIILYCSGSLDNWDPASTKVRKPSSDRMHDLSDALFIPGFPTDVGTFDKPGDDEMVLAWDKVKIGSASSPLDRSKVIREIDLEIEFTPQLLAIDIRLNTAQALLTPPGPPAVAALALIESILPTRKMIGGTPAGWSTIPPAVQISPLGQVTGGLLGCANGKTEAT